MLLALNIGNSNIILGIFDKNQLIFNAVLSTEKNKTADEYAASLKGIFDVNNIQSCNILGIVISCVVPPLLLPVSEAAKKICKVEPIIVGPGIKTGLNIKIENPAQLGSDFVAMTVSATHGYSSPTIIVNIGTATTFSAISEKGEFLGTIIYPGINISYESLSLKTAQLPYISFDAPKALIGKNTIDSMKSGLIYGSATLIDGMIEKIADELASENMKVIATGTYAGLIIPYCKHDIEINPHLLLEGLYLLYKKNS